ncbi:MAG: response regulator [Spirochaetaceae bacterium]|nr:response regulator [Myxococcales bacterium]MCB9724030.1 response regulator [Spirochaetaceae bacterium]HPG25662.1 response regulator [Myxococcota bacterium]
MAAPLPLTDRSRVLVVDDERGPRESLRMILSGRYEVVTATRGAEALEILRTDSIDLVTVDLNMPGMKGDELMRTIRRESPQTEIIVITGCGSVESAIEGIRHGVFDYLTKPFDVVQVTASVERALERQASRARMVGFLEGLSRILGRNRDAAIVLEELEASPLAQERLRSVLSEPVLAGERRGSRPDGPRTVEFLEVLAETIESRDLTMRGHARRVAFYADLVGAALCLSREERQNLQIAAFLHDIGKVGAPTDLLAGEVMLEPERLAAIHPHPAIGERLLHPLGLDPVIATTVRHHHERYDGRGYPDGLSGDDIPLAARIIAVVDAFDAMTCERPYRQAQSSDEALAELHRESGGQFDPAIARIFRELVVSGAADEVREAGTLAWALAESAGARVRASGFGDDAFGHDGRGAA